MILFSGPGSLPSIEDTRNLYTCVACWHAMCISAGCVYIYIYTYVLIFMYIHICMYICEYVRRYVHI